MKKIISLLSTILLMSTICSAQVQYCGTDPSVKNVQNLITYSDQVDNAAWIKGSMTVGANTVNAPDGQTTAETVTLTAAAANHSVYPAVVTVVDGSVYRMSVYLKAGTHQYVVLRTLNPTTANISINLSTGVIAAADTGVLSSAITNVGNGWYRVEMTYAQSGSTSAYLVLYGTNSSYVLSWTPVGTETFHVWGASMQLASSPNQYAATTDTQVLAGSYGTVPKSYQSNLLLRSEEFDNAAWVKPQSTVTANTVPAPDGATTADTILETAVSNYHGVYQFVNVTSGLTYRMAVYAKAQNRSVIQIEASSGAFGANAYASYNLADGTLGAVGSAATATITSVGNGWYLCTLFAPATATTTSAFNIHTATTIGAALREIYLGVITNGVYLWGAQVNLAAYPSDYRRTSSSASTLGPQCTAGTSQSLLDPSRCFVISAGNPLKLTPFQGGQTSTNVDLNQAPLTPYKGSSH